MATHANTEATKIPDTGDFLVSAGREDEKSGDSGNIDLSKSAENNPDIPASSDKDNFSGFMEKNPKDPTTTSSGKDTPSDSTAKNTGFTNSGTFAEKDDDSITLCLMGDLMCLAGQQYTAERKDGSHDYTDSFFLLHDTFACFDFVVGNLETTLSESNPYSTAAREVNEQPNCNAPADYLASLKWAGITHLVTANNHCLDGGAVGIEETIAHLDEYAIPHTGTYRADYNGARYMILKKNGIRIAVLSFTELINQRALLTKTQLSHMIDAYSRTDVTERIAQARADGADYVIVYEHWGSENVHEVRGYQRDHAKEIAAAGADLIIGSHPHCLQEMETITTEDGREVPCFYSLGNVVSSMTREINHDTVFVQVKLEQKQDAAGGVAAVSITLLPCHVLASLDGHSRVITPVDYKTGNQKTDVELSAAKERIERILPEK